VAKYCEEKECEERAEFQIGKPRWVHGLLLEKRRWMRVCTKHESEIGNSNDRIRGELPH